MSHARRIHPRRALFTLLFALSFVALAVAINGNRASQIDPTATIAAARP